MAYNYEYPYDDAGQYNNDWLLHEMKKFLSEFDTVKNSFEELNEYVKNFFANLDVQAEIDAKIDSLLSSGELMKFFYKTLGFVSPVWLGAKGDGSSNDTDAFIQALEYGTVFVPKGRYLIEGLNITSPIFMFGTESSILLPYDSYTGDMITLTNVNESVIKDISIRSGKGYAITLENSNANRISINTYSQTYGIYIKDSFSNRIENSRIYCQQRALMCVNAISTLLENNLFSTTSAYNIIEATGSNITISNCTADTGQISLTGGRHYFTNLRTESAKKTLILNNCILRCTNCDVERHADSASSNTEEIFNLSNNAILIYDGSIRYQDYNNLNWKNLTYYRISSGSFLYGTYIPINLIPNNVESPNSFLQSILTTFHTNAISCSIDRVLQGVTIKSNADNSISLTGTAAATSFSVAFATFNCKLTGRYVLTGSDGNEQLWVDAFSNGDSGSGLYMDCIAGTSYPIVIQIFVNRNYNTTIYPNIKLVSTESRFNAYTGDYGTAVGDLTKN